jgi:hypothetical protein
MVTERKPKGGERVAFYLMAVPLGLILLIVAPSIATTFSPAYRAAELSAHRHKLESDINQVQTAVLNYYTEYSVYPVAPDNATLVKMLTGLNAGGNARQVAFLNLKPSDFNDQGELLDPRGTPIQFSVTADGTLHARSAGPDKTFGTADDIVGKFSAADETQR